MGKTECSTSDGEGVGDEIDKWRECDGGMEKQGRLGRRECTETATARIARASDWPIASKEKRKRENGGIEQSTEQGGVVKARPA